MPIGDGHSAATRLRLCAEAVGMRILRVYHGGREQDHRARERALVAAGLDVTLVVPDCWSGPSSEAELSKESFRIVELPVRRPGDVNRHAYVDRAALRAVLAETRPDVLDIHEEPFSLATRQWLGAAPADLPVVLYTAQNIDKRYPPPFAFYEREAYQRVRGLYPCSRQAASVARGKGFRGLIEVHPLGFDENAFSPGGQRREADELVFAFVGRLVPEKGALDAVETLAVVNRKRSARLLMVGEGPEGTAAARRAADLGLADRLELSSWLPQRDLAEMYRRVQVALIPSRTSSTWVEQFGRVVVEAQASGVIVAGYRTGTIPEVGGEAAVLVEEGDTAALAKAVLRALANDSEYRDRRRAGLALAAQRTWTRIARQQAAFYERVVKGESNEVRAAPSAAARREAARAEFGPTALTPAGARPFALPLLRRGGGGAKLLGALVDASVELRAGMPSR
jgi:glycosyltransferase involved in cell wall biosynthesis